jgi:hypothetical protein
VLVDTVHKKVYHLSNPDVLSIVSIEPQ